MRSDVARDLSDSAFEFDRVVWPAMADKCGGGRIAPVEAVSHDGFDKELDMLAGIDAWQVVDGTGIRGIASRVQWTERPFETFTIRKSRTSGAKTEWAKQIEAMKSRDRGFLRSHITIHAYIHPPKRSGRLLFAAAIRTADLFSFADDKWRGDVWFEKPNPSDGNIFAAFRIPKMKAMGVKVAVFDARP